MHVGGGQRLQCPMVGDDVRCVQGGNTAEYHAVLLHHVVQSFCGTYAHCILVGSSYHLSFLPLLRAGSTSQTTGLWCNYSSTPCLTSNATDMVSHCQSAIQRSWLISTYRMLSSLKYPLWGTFFPVNMKHGFKLEPLATTHSIVITSSRLALCVLTQFCWSWANRYWVPSRFLTPTKLNSLFIHVVHILQGYAILI